MIFVGLLSILQYAELVCYIAVCYAASPSSSWYY